MGLGSRSGGWGACCLPVALLRFSHGPSYVSALPSRTLAIGSGRLYSRMTSSYLNICRDPISKQDDIHRNWGWDRHVFLGT